MKKDTPPPEKKTSAGKANTAAALISGCLAWAVFFCVRLLGRKLSMRIAGSASAGRQMSRLLDLLFSKKNHYRQQNLRRIFPGITDADIALLAQQGQVNIARTAIETIFMTAAEFPAITVTGLENLHAAGSDGVLLVSGHTGNLYYGPFCARMLGYDTAFLHLGTGNRLIDRLSHRLLARLCIPVPSTDTARFVAHIAAGGNAFIVPDIRVKNRRNSSRLQFCGHPAWTSTFIAEMAITHRRPIVPTYTIRHPDNRIEQVFEPAIDLSSGDKNIVQQHINDSISARVLAAPGNWTLWNSNRWGP